MNDKDAVRIIFFDSDIMDQLLHRFFDDPPPQCGTLHNERSLQLELAVYFRNLGHSVEFERPFKLPRPIGSTAKPKKNLDLLIDQNGQKIGVELKVPLNGQHPETLYSYCMDIEFVEALICHEVVDRGFCLMATNDPLFWTDKVTGSEIHNKFRRENEILSGPVRKPTGKKDTQVILTGSYKPKSAWRPVKSKGLLGNAHYLLLEASLNIR